MRTRDARHYDGRVYCGDCPALCIEKRGHTTWFCQYLLAFKQRSFSEYTVKCDLLEGKVPSLERPREHKEYKPRSFVDKVRTGAYEKASIDSARSFYQWYTGS
jgi:hypothetical protein